MGLLGTILSKFTGKPLHPKDEVTYKRILCLTEAEVNQPHPAGGKRKPELNYRGNSIRLDKFRWEGDVTVRDMATGEVKTFEAAVKANSKSEARARIKKELPNHKILVCTLARSV